MLYISITYDLINYICLFVDRTIPTISCPVSFVYQLTEELDNVIDYAAIPPTYNDDNLEDITLIYDPPTLIVSGSDAGTEQVVKVMAQDVDENNATCSFIIVFEGSY